MPKDELRLTIHQTSPILGEVEANEEEVRKRVQETFHQDLLVFPELSLTGYNLRSGVQRMARRVSEDSPIGLPPGSPPVAFGLPERGGDELVYNSGLVVHENRVLAKHRKVYLPTYGLFDENRYFAAGRDVPPVVTLPTGWKVGLLICEDFWHPSLIYLLAAQGAEVVLVLSAAPGRGEPEPTAEEQPERRPDSSEEGALLFASTANWTLLARTAALQYGVFMALANRAGVEEGVTFAGESTVVGPDGKILARGPQAEPAVLEVSLPREALRRARNPYAHLRDDDPEYLRRALDTLLGGP
jgi:predicted amidohydrolase